jgi:hypothetical protein
VVVLKKDLQRLSLELAFATINILVNGLERLDVEVDHLFCSPVIHENLSTENNQAIFGCLRVVAQLANC